MAIKIIRNVKNIKKDSLPLVIGYFGCIHVMHQQLLSKYHEFNILTFTDLMSKKEHQIYNYRHRLSNLEKFDPQNIYVLDVSTTNMTGEKFIKNVLNKLQPSEILVGEDFKFGSDDLPASKLKDLFKLNILRYNSDVSTKKIYELITKGKLDQANDYMSFYLYFIGKWIKGMKKGRQIGYPTINLKNERPFVLPQGSYASFITIGNKKYKAVTFVGKSKIVNHKELMVETHVFDTKIKPRNLYPVWVRNHIKVEFVKYIRPMENFNSLNSLKAAIQKDINAAKKYFKEQAI